MEELRANGNPVYLRPETMGKRALLGSLDDTLIMAERISGVEPCLDFAHLHARSGDGRVNSFEEWCTVLEKIQNALGAASLQRLHCHVSGIAYTAKGEKHHLLLAESDFNLDGLLRSLIKYNCGGRILCESPQEMDREAIRIKTRWLTLQGENV